MNSVNAIQSVVIYCGHRDHPEFGSYHDNIMKQQKMFELLNEYRKAASLNPWKILSAPGEKLIDILEKEKAEETLLVIPAGQSARLDAVFSIAQIAFMNDFFARGGRGYFTCGAAYWASAKRIYKEVCEEHTDTRQTVIKTSKLPLFQGIAEGPLCPFPGKKYKVGFYSDAVAICCVQETCTIFLSGGGSFIPEATPSQKVRVLVRYSHSELIRLGKQPEECPKWENGAILISVGKGAVLLAMFHPYYGSQDIDTEAYERAFPDCGTDWKRVHAKLSPVDERMQFFIKHMLKPLEEKEFYA